MSGTEVIVFIIVSSVVLAALFVVPYWWLTRKHICPAPQVDEPDAITRLAVADPKSDAGQRVKDWEAWVAYRDHGLALVNAGTERMQRQISVMQQRCSYMRDLSRRHQKRLSG